MRIISIIFSLIILSSCEDTKLKNNCERIGIFKNDSRFENCMESYDNMFVYEVQYDLLKKIQEINEYNQLAKDFNSTNKLQNKSEYEEVDIEVFTKKYEIDALNFDSKIDEIENKKITFDASFSYDLLDEGDQGPLSITISKWIADTSGETPTYDTLYYFDSAFQNFELQNKTEKFDWLFWTYDFIEFEELIKFEDVRFYGYFVYDTSLVLEETVFLIEQMEFPQISTEGLFENYTAQLQDRIRRCQISNENIEDYINLVKDLFDIKLNKSLGEFCNYD